MVYFLISGICQKICEKGRLEIGMIRWQAGSVASVYFFAFLYEKWNQINN